MIGLATITSKRQFTIPVAAFEDLNFRVGQKVVVTSDNGALKITPAEKLVNDLAGSIRVPKKFKNKNIDEIIEIAKARYFAKKYGVRGH